MTYARTYIHKERKREGERNERAKRSRKFSILAEQNFPRVNYCGAAYLLADTFVESESEKGTRDSDEKAPASEKVTDLAVQTWTLDVVGVGFPATVLVRIAVAVVLRKLTSRAENNMTNTVGKARLVTYRVTLSYDSAREIVKILALP